MPPRNPPTHQRQEEKESSEEEDDSGVSVGGLVVFGATLVGIFVAAAVTSKKDVKVPKKAPPIPVVMVFSFNRNHTTPSSRCSCRTTRTTTC